MSQVYNKIGAFGKGQQLEAFVAEYEFQDYDRTLVRGGAEFQINGKVDPAEVSRKYPDLTVVYDWTDVAHNKEGWSEWVNGKMVESHEEETDLDEDEDE